MAVSAGPDIVENGLVLCLDAGNRRSYPGTGSSWNDVCLTNNATLFNTPTYSNSNGGVLSFDGTDDYGTVTNDVSSGTNDFAVSVWVYKTEIVSNRYIWDFGPNGGTLSSGTAVTPGFRYYNPTIGTAGPLYTSGPAHNINTWYNIVVSRISSVTSIYSNGSFAVSGSDTGNIGSWGTTFNIARYGGGGFVLQGNISCIMVYKNKGLNEQEILQNFNALRGRFNI